MYSRIRDGWQASEGRLPSMEARGLAQRAFRQGDVPAVRRFAHSFCARAGIASGRVSDFVLAVSEASACATAWGPCTARVRLWLAGGRAFCEVSGDGMLVREAARADRPGRPGGRGGGAAPPGAAPALRLRVGGRQPGRRPRHALHDGGLSRLAADRSGGQAAAGLIGQ